MRRMTQGCYDIKDHDPGPIRFYCPDCHKWSQQQRDKLIEQFGAEHGMPDLLAKVRPCERDNSYSNRCQLRYWDSMRDSARATAIGKGGMPDTWRERIPERWWHTIREFCEDLDRPPPLPERHVSFYDRKDFRR